MIGALSGSESWNIATGLMADVVLVDHELVGWGGQFHESKVKSKIPPGVIPLNSNRLFSTFLGSMYVSIMFWGNIYSEVEHNLLLGRKKGVEKSLFKFRGIKPGSLATSCNPSCGAVLFGWIYERRRAGFDSRPRNRVCDKSFHPTKQSKQGPEKRSTLPSLPYPA